MLPVENPDCIAPPPTWTKPGAAIEPATSFESDWHETSQKVAASQKVAVRTAPIRKPSIEGEITHCIRKSSRYATTAPPEYTTGFARFTLWGCVHQAQSGRGAAHVPARATR